MLHVIIYCKKLESKGLGGLKWHEVNSKFREYWSPSSETEREHAHSIVIINVSSFLILLGNCNAFSW
jgi:hypothetical protein